MEKQYLYLAVGFPYDMIAHDEKRYLINKELYELSKSRKGESSGYVRKKDRRVSNEERENIFKKYAYDPKDAYCRQRVLYATLNYGEIENKNDWDSEGGFFSHILISKVSLPFDQGGCEEEIKWLKIKEYKGFCDLSEYEQIERPEFYKNISGFSI